MAPAAEQMKREELVLADLLEKIENGTYPVGDPIPSTPALIEIYGYSKTPIRRAVEALQRAGILAGQTGSRVVVQRKPTEAEVTDAQGAGEQLSQLAGEVQQLASRLDDVAPDLADLKKQVALMQAQIMDLYAKGGYANPYQQQPAPIAGRKARSA